MPTKKKDDDIANPEQTQFVELVEALNATVLEKIGAQGTGDPDGKMEKDRGGLHLRLARILPSFANPKKEKMGGTRLTRAYFEKWMELLTGLGAEEVGTFRTRIDKLLNPEKET